MSTADESHNDLRKEPSGTADAHAPASGDSHDDHGHDAHPPSTDFIPENSALDQLLKLVVVLAGFGLITMLWVWYEGDIVVEPSERATSEHSAPVVHESTTTTAP